MSSINLSSLAFEGKSGYLLQSVEDKSGRMVRRYRRDPECSVAQAVLTIEALLLRNPQLVFLPGFSDRTDLEQLVRYRTHLVMNGCAVCLSEKDKARETTANSLKEEASSFGSSDGSFCEIEPPVDTFFSEAVIDEPVICEEGHSFEKKYIQAWVERKGDLCPCSLDGRIHRVGIHQLQKTLVDKAFEGMQKAVRYIQRMDMDTVREKGWEVAKNFTIGLIPGGSFVQRSASVATMSREARTPQEYATVGVNVAAGVASLVPGVGGVIATGIDAATIAYRWYEDFSREAMDEKTAREILGLASPVLTRKEVSDAYDFQKSESWKMDESFKKNKAVWDLFQKQLDLARVCLYRICRDSEDAIFVASSSDTTHG